MNTLVTQSEEAAWKSPAVETFSGTVEPKKRILIVESDKAGAGKLVLQLGSAGYDAGTRDAANAAMAAKNTPPDLVIVDISMFGEGGFAIAQRIQQSVGWCVPTIFLTAGTEPRLRKKAEVFEAAGVFRRTTRDDGIDRSHRGSPARGGRDRDGGTLSLGLLKI